jgi:penicillin amidase
MYDETFGNTQQPLAVSWMGHEASSEMTTYIRLNQAHNYQDYLKAMSYYYGCPSLAFVFASAQGDIAIRQQGKYVLRWPEQGKYVLDGSRSDHLWQQFIPWDQVPAVLNPARGFVSSANQHPTGAAYPYYYLPVGAFEAYRGRRLNALLAERDTFTPEDMQAMQLDHTGLLAADILPLMLRELDTLSLTQPQRRAWEELRRWDYAYARDKAAPTVFTRWWAEIMTTIWGDEIKAAGMTLRMPSSAVTTRILQDSVRFSFYRTVGDTTGTDRTALINRTFAQMVSKLHQEYPDSRDWAWARRKTTDILHLTRILRPLGRTGLETDGAGGVLNATERTSGPSWRMIVALGPEPRAWAAYPGGQTGNPGSPAYEKFIETWRAGQYYELWFMKNSADPRHPVTSRLQLHP